MGDKISFMIVVLVIACFCFSKTEGKSTRVLTKTPINTAVVSGDSINFECASDTTFINWYFQAHTGDPTVHTVYDGQALNPQFAGIYDVELKTGGQCDLIVINTTFSETGTYRCKESTGFEPHQTAGLIVLDSEPECSINVTTPSVYIGDVIEMSCRVSYTANLSPALMTWTNPQGSTVTATEDVRQGYLESNITVIAAVPTVGQYRCRTRFDAPPPESIITAKNAPEYEYNFNTPVLAVNYCPSSVQITVPPGEHRVGDVISCTSNGYPAPTLTWTHVETGQQTTGSTLTINRAGVNTYICTATVEIPDQSTCTLSTTTNVTVIASSCLEMKQTNNMTASGRYTLTLSNGKTFEVYCEMGLNGGGYTFLSPQSLLDLTDDDIQPLYTDRTNFLMRLRKFDDLQTYSVMRQLNVYRHIPIRIGLSNHDGYYNTQNELTTRLGLPYLYFGFLTLAMTNNGSFTTMGFNINNIDVSGAKTTTNYNHIALFPGFLEAGYASSGSSAYAGCTTMFTSQQIVVPSSRPMPEEYFMSLEVYFNSPTAAVVCFATSNSVNMVSTWQVRNAAIGFR